MRPNEGLDLVGQRFGRLVVISKEGRDKNRHIIWYCKCDCGGEARCLTSNLTRGKSKSCKCLRDEKNKKRRSMSRLAFEGEVPKWWEGRN